MISAMKSWFMVLALTHGPKPFKSAIHRANNETLPSDRRLLCDGSTVPAGAPLMRTAISKAFFLAALLYPVVSPADAEVRILASPGGQVGLFLDLFERVRESGERVVIDGPCLSACTLVLSTVPNNRICVTRRAVLGFHAARSIDRRGRLYAEPEASQAVLAAYPAPVRGWISRRGGLTSRLLVLRGRELAAIYPTCR
jgi:hypothetical protein